MVMALIGVMAIGTGTVSGVENDAARAVLVGRSPVGVSSACGGEGDGVGAQCDAPHAVRQTELSAIARPAIIGLSSQPVKGYSTPAAMGMPMML